MGRVGSRKGRGPWGQVSGRWRGGAAEGAWLAVVAVGVLRGFLVMDLSREGVWP